MNHIELFSGCGGMSLGLKKSGFELLLANELSPMAAETFAYNFLDEDLEEKANQNLMPQNVIWLKSKYNELLKRLRENPFEFPDNTEEGFSDLPKDLNGLKGKLLVGNLIELNKLLEKNVQLKKVLSSAFKGGGNVDLISGGPPCQSFSMAGKRAKDCDKNTLPWEFAKFVNVIRPKLVLLENVTGILRAFKDDNNNEFHAWYEVSKVFASINYIPLCLHVNARKSGVPQNRPRFIMIGVSQKHFDSINKRFNEAEKELFKQSLCFHEMVSQEGEKLPLGHLPYFDVNKPKDLKLIKNSFLKDLVSSPETSVKDAIDDLKINKKEKKSDYVSKLNDEFDFLKERSEIINHDFRNNSLFVKRRFRIYQVLKQIGVTSLTTSILNVLKGNSSDISSKEWELLSKFNFLHENGELLPFKCKKEFINFLKAHPTKKQTQKALIADAPAPAALSIPDDACHYDERELRVLTVREMARIQSFPDQFVFRSKVTTGGKMRRYEVPQYTQVGNAVPPLLALQLGKCLKKLL
ncbi:DNA (cytosine-5-)-methyltransferase [Pseudoalteromonas aurantia]|uniref:DNA cytosine methyltransferase n=1 Tax=Pseudoalteromonas aurantia TaxID=43654 RepID=UPI00110BBAC1|nr:DNA cytosine methyltransferase [Pseudoalteromonas aurantia]TMO58496.1 DNA (cytosine-5-)-methyltransferase [Pseudoalteromonas aurantia]